MHRVFQQKRIKGKNCLVEEEHREALMDILNLLSGKVETEVREEGMSMEEQEVEDVFIDESSQKIEEMGLAEEIEIEVVEEKIEEGVQGESQEKVQNEENEQVTKETSSAVEENEDKEGDEIEGKTKEEEAFLAETEEACEKIPVWYYSANGSLVKR